MIFKINKLKVTTFDSSKIIRLTSKISLSKPWEFSNLITVSAYEICHASNFTMLYMAINLSAVKCYDKNVW